MVQGVARVRYSTRMPTRRYGHLSREQVVHPILCGSTMNRLATIHLTATIDDLSAPFNPREIFAASLNEKIEAKLKEVQA